LLQGLTIKNAALQISPGIELSFAQNKSLLVSSGGAINADGSLARISFSSIENFNWKGIIFESAANFSNSSLINCTIEFGGSDLAAPANLMLDNSAPLIDNCEIKNSAGYGVYYKGKFFPSSFINNQFAFNELGALSVPASAVADLNLQKFGTDATNFIHVRGGPSEGIISTDCVWTDLNVPYKIENSLQILSGVLTLDPKVHLIMSAASGMEINRQGGLIADGSSGLITIEGQTHSAGYWGNIYFAPQAQLDKCKLIHCRIRHGGGFINQPGMIYSEICAPVIRNCYIENSGSWGIYFTQSCSLADLNSNFFYNNVAGNFYSLP
jgi:predicted outer membrane repeat protein